MKDVTDKVRVGAIDDEILSILQCVCGHRFDPWEHHIGIYPDSPTPCPHCGVRLVFNTGVRVMDVDGKADPALVEEARDTLCNVAQLIAGWKTTTPVEQWSQWDEETYQKLLRLQARIEGLLR